MHVSPRLALAPVPPTPQPILGANFNRAPLTLRAHAISCLRVRLGATARGGRRMRLQQPLLQNDSGLIFQTIFRHNTTRQEH